MEADPKKLLLDAFEQARRSGKSGNQMSIAVLNNRMRQLSNNEFDYRELGFQSFLSFLKNCSDLVTIDRTTQPPTARLLGSEQDTTPGTAITTSERVRSDLWKAVMDYSSGQDYVWDQKGGIARPHPEAADDELVLPTITPEKLDEMREEFDSSQSPGATQDERDQLTRWKEKRLSTGALPGRLRGLWNRELKRHAIETLRTWFAEHNIPTPPDLVVTVKKSPDRPTNRLRDWVHAIVEEMTDEELRSLSLPARASLKASKR